MNIVDSADGTAIAFDIEGAGDPVILVSGALGGRAGDAALAGLLASDFTVFSYDRRGRGDSGDAAQYSVDREIDDLAAVLTAAGGSAYVFGTSSGANLTFAAARHGLAISKAAAWEPNFLVDDSRPPLPPEYVAHLRELVTSGCRGDAVEYFMTAAVGLPAEFVAPMRSMPMWPDMEAVAHTLAYDGTIVGESMSGKPLSDEWSDLNLPVLVLDGGQTPWLTAGAAAIAAAIPHAERRTLPNQPHNVAPEALAPALQEFFAR
jgi:pimeloyl-ACP methyl ester carboxylesterase